MTETEEIIAELQSLQKDMTILEALVAVHDALTPHVDKEGKIYMDHLITYTRKIAVELKRRQQDINKKLSVQIRKTGVDV